MIPARPDAPPRTPLRVVLDLLRAGGDVVSADGQDDASTETVLTGVTMSSRSVRPGDLYVAPAGTSCPPTGRTTRRRPC